MKAVPPVIIPGFRRMTFAKDQPQYHPLPAIIDFDGNELITHWRMNWRERLRVLFFGEIFVRLLVFGRAYATINPLTPMYVHVDPPVLQEYDHQKAKTAIHGAAS